MNNVETLIESVYVQLDGNEDAVEYHKRHGIHSMQILTVTAQEEAFDIVNKIRTEIEGKNVIEIGAGIGVLSLEMAQIAKTVVAIEADPAWSWVFTKCLYAKKPNNLTWVFGTAESVSKWLRGDIAVIVTRSDHKGMQKIAREMCPIVIDINERFDKGEKMDKCEECDGVGSYSDGGTLSPTKTCGKCKGKGYTGTKNTDLPDEDKNKIVKKVYEQYCNGDHITDKNLMIAIETTRVHIDFVRSLGKEFSLFAVKLSRFLEALESYSDARLSGRK